MGNYRNMAEELYNTLSSLLSSEYFDSAPERFQSINILERELKTGKDPKLFEDKMREFKENTNRQFLPRLNEMILNNFWTMNFKRTPGVMIERKRYNEEADYVRRAK